MNRRFHVVGWPSEILLDYIASKIIFAVLELHRCVGYYSCIY